MRIEPDGDFVVHVGPVRVVVHRLRLKAHAHHETQRLAKRAELEGLHQRVALAAPAAQRVQRRLDFRRSQGWDRQSAPVGVFGKCRPPSGTRNVQRSTSNFQSSDPGVER